MVGENLWFTLRKSNGNSKTLMLHQAFIQTLLLISAFEQRLSFLMFYFVKNDLKIIVKCMREAGVDVSSEAGW